MSRYTIRGPGPPNDGVNLTTTDARILTAYASATPYKRILVDEFCFNAQIANATGTLVPWIDEPLHWLLRRFTGGPPSGGTAVTPAPCDPGDSTAVSGGMHSATGGTSTFTTLFESFRAMRLPLEWRCLAPGKEFKSAAAQNNGIEMLCSYLETAWAGIVAGTMFFEE